VSVARAGASEPAEDYSTWSAVALAVLIAGLAGAGLLIAADLSTLVQIKVITVTKATFSGHERHLWAMVILGAFAVPLAYGAARRRSRPAMVALVLVGAAALLITLVHDLPDTRSEGVYGEQYEDAVARPGPGFWMEAGGALLLILSGAGGLMLLSPPPARSPADPAPRTP
jgi:hypothetical protein